MVESTLDLHHDDDLSIVASQEDEEDDQSYDSLHDGSSFGGTSSHDNNGKGRRGRNRDAHGNKIKRSKTAPTDLVRRETKALRILKWVILSLLITGGALLGFGTFRWVEQGGDSSTTTSSCLADSAAENLQDIYGQALEHNLQQGQVTRFMAAFTVSASLTSFVLSSSQPLPEETTDSGLPPADASSTTGDWPYVTIPHYDARLTGLLESTNAQQIRFAPLVDPALRTTFEAYAVAQQLQECDTCPPQTEIWDFGTGLVTPSDDSTVLAPIWQVTPFTTEPLILQNILSSSSSSPEGETLLAVQSLGAGLWTDVTLSGTQGPSVTLVYPIYQDFQQVQMTAVLSMDYYWKDLLQEALPFDLTLLVDATATATEEDPSYLTILLESCSGQIDAFSLLPGSADSSTNTVEYFTRLTSIPTVAQEASVSFSLPGGYYYGASDRPLTETDENTSNSNVCHYRVWLVPTELTEDLFSGMESGVKGDDNSDSNKAALYTGLVSSLFFLLLFCFLIYDWLMEKRQSVVVNIATKSSAIVENLFPAQVRDRMLQGLKNGDAKEDPEKALETGVSKNAMPATSERGPGPVSVKQFLTSDDGMTNNLSSQPIADLFPNTTVLFADIAGFTAWSSQREPPQVFTLLETLYRSFDVIAKKLKVFKVETIGDCYMAVTGLPNPDESHAVHMSRFAYQCLVGMKDLTRELEAMLGPGTSDLALRVGLHSGPVTAGVLRGEKSRFQLFGDTVNTASRMESTGIRGKIQISQETADLLMAAGKSHWLKSRDEAVVAKGKGELKTYWLDPTKKRRTTKTQRDIRVAQDISINGNGVDKPLGPGDVAFDDKYARLIDWNVDVLLHHLARVISNRSRNPSRGSLVNHSSEVPLLPAAINDVAEVVALPPFDPDASRFRRARPDVSMLQQTRADLHEYVKRIAMYYHDVPFHNFEHASHVTLCANKLLNRLINSDEYSSEEDLHNATYGISSDPLTHFAIVFAALIHDVDHTGLPNAQLVKDGHEIAGKFSNRSAAEQNSVHMGWEMLMDPRFERLRKCIYQTNVERKRFRQLVINSVLATDIADRQVNEERQIKWERAFSQNKVAEQSGLQLQEEMNRKATAVIEHIIQVSDVAHTMQHWHIYRRWNERLFHEMHEAFSTGRVAVDPSTNWYVGELGFFDYYLIPLAMKLKECGVFGASGYEYISYVLKNKKEWERKGRQVVQEMILLYKDAEEDDATGSSFDSDDYDSDDLEYDSPGDLSSSEDETED